MLPEKFEAGSIKTNKKIRAWSVMITFSLKDNFVTKCKKITQEIDETELDIGYSFMTEDDMVQANFPQSLARQLFISNKMMLFDLNKSSHHTPPIQGGRSMVSKLIAKTIRPYRGNFVVVFLRSFANPIQSSKPSMVIKKSQ